jgi:phosphatidylserine/phosphatidylglycerophosphate/cardiolipin synthase-like enzyme
MLLLIISLFLGLAVNNHTLSPALRPILYKAASAVKKVIPKAQKYIETAKSELITGQSIPVTKVYFMPDDKEVFKEVMLGLIHSEKKGIDIAAFTFNYKQFADALLEAAHRGVKIRIVADGNNAQSQYSKISQLNHKNITRYVFYPRTGGKWEPLMHHKFMIFKSNLGSRSFLEKGSFNYSQSGFNNQENAEITSSIKIVPQFSKHFEELIKRCKPYKL